MVDVWASGPHHGRVPSATANTNRRYVDGASSTSVVSLGGGEYALSCSGTSTISNISLTTNTLGTTTQLVVGAKLRFPSALPSTSPDLAVSGSSGGNDLYLFFQQSSGKLAMAWGAGTAVASLSTVTFDVDYAIDLHVDRGVSPNVARWWVNGVPQTNVTDAQASGNVSGFTFGRDSAATGTYYWRDMRVSTTAGDAPLGRGRVAVLVPSGTATEIGTANSMCRFTSNGGGLDTTFVSADIVAALAEIPPVVSAASTGVYQRTSGTANAISVPMSSVTLGGGETVELCTIRVLGWSASTTANNLELRAYDGSAETALIVREDPNFDNSTTTPAWWCAAYTPSGGWSQAKLDALEIRIGYSNDVSPVPGAHAIYAEVAIKSAPASPAAVAAVASVPAVTVSTGAAGDATTTPSTVAAVGAVPAPTLSTGSTITATTVAGVAGIGTATASAGSRTSPSSAAAMAGVDAVTVSAGSRVSPASVAGVASVGTTTTVSGSTITATAVAATAGVGAVAFASSATPAPAAVAASAGIGTAAASAGATASPAAVVLAASAPAPTVSAGSLVAAAAVAAVASVPTPTVAASGNVTVSASAVAGLASVPAPTVATGSTVTATAAASAVGVGAATVGTGSTAQPVTVAATASVPAATPSAGATLTLTTLAGVAAVASPTITIGTQAAPDSVGAVASISAPGLIADNTVDVASVDAYASVGAVAVTTRSRITYRPDTGTTTRVSTGVTVRPDLGVTVRP